jgi:hypothetical protein
MAATAAQIAEVRRMVNEPTTSTYSDVLITAIIERYPLLDELGSDPYTWTAANPPVRPSPPYTISKPTAAITPAARCSACIRSWAATTGHGDR